MFVQVERDGPDACQGWLASVRTDYLTLQAPGGALLHLPLHHIRSVTPGAPPGDRCGGPDVDLQTPGNFAELLALHLDRPVRLYHAGPEVSAGILRHCDTDHVLLEVADGALVCFARFHIRSLFPLPDETVRLGAHQTETEHGR